MDEMPLDNPVWSALTTRQAGLAQGDGPARRYAAAIAPFLAVADAGPRAAAAALALAAPGESLYFVGLAPDSTSGWEVDSTYTVAQMVHQGVLTSNDDDDLIRLGPDDAVAMRTLMATVYPGYYRPETHRMGLYLGVRRHGRLIAMAGQRMHLNGYREISAVATLPEFRGRGLAGRLVGRLVREILAEDLTPFLHVDADNDVAIAAYEKAGFRRRGALTVLKVRRLG